MSGVTNPPRLGGGPKSLQDTGPDRSHSGRIQRRSILFPRKENEYTTLQSNLDGPTEPVTSLSDGLLLRLSLLSPRLTAFLFLSEGSRVDS